MDVLTALRRTLELLESSRTSLYSADRVEQLRDALGDIVRAIESGERPDPSELSFLYAPTGSIQDTSIDNGWGDEFLALAEAVDAYVADLRKRPP